MSTGSDIQNDIKEILLANGDIFSVKRQTTTTDGMGRVTNVSNSTFRIYGYIKDTSKKDRKVQEMGLAVPGNRVMYLRDQYSLVSGGTSTYYVVQEDDILVDRESKEWRIVKIIHEPFYNDVEIYKKVVVKNISLEGSS